MSQTDLARVRSDLETLRTAIGAELPFSRDEIRGSLWLAACGALLAVWPMFTPAQQRWSLAVPVGLCVLAAIKPALAARRRRAVHPSRWREHRLNLLAAALVTPAVFAYLRWERSIGVPRQAIGAAVVFCVGLGLLFIAATDRVRRVYIGGAVPLMAFGLAIPFCSPQQVVTLGGACVAAAGLAAAAIMSYQLRASGDAHDAD